MSETEAEAEDEDEIVENESSTESEVEIVDEGLHQSLSAYVESVCKIVDSFSDRASRTRSGSWSTSAGVTRSQNRQNTISQEDAENIVERISQNWKDYPGYTQCKSSFEVCNIYEKETGYATEMGVIDNPDERENLIKSDTLPKFFKRYFVKNDGADFDEETFNKTYSEFEKYLTTDSVTYQGRTILTEFEMEPAELELDEGLRIIQIGNDELTSEFPGRYHLHPRFRTADELFILEKEYETNKFEGNQIHQAIQAFEEVVLALHLFEVSGDVGYTQPITEPTSLFHESHARAGGHIAKELFNEKLFLSSENSEEFNRFWNTIKPQIIDPPESFRIALDKFSNSFQRANQNDRLLDLVITLEAMYLKEGENQEMSYRLSQRGALFIGENKEQALDIKSSLRKSYNKRSTLVHGGVADVSHEEIIELHEYTRKSLATFLKSVESGNEHKQLLKELDEQAVTPV